MELVKSTPSFKILSKQIVNEIKEGPAVFLYLLCVVIKVIENLLSSFSIDGNPN